MDRSFRVEVTKDYLVFAAAHFVVFNEHEREPLHGHNYRLRVLAEGALDQYGFVLDFSVLKRMGRRFVDAIDHRVLLAARNPRLAYREEGDSVHVQYEGRPAYVLPAAEVVMLPIVNTTVELIAEYLADQFERELAVAGYRNLTMLEVEVEENAKQSAIHRRRLFAD